VAVAVVDGLEVVEVEEHEGEDLVGAFSAERGMVKSFQQQAAVG